MKKEEMDLKPIIIDKKILANKKINMKVYIYLLSLSHKTDIKESYIYTDVFNISAIARELGLGKSIVKNCIEELKSNGILIKRVAEEDRFYFLDTTEISYVKFNLKELKELIDLDSNTLKIYFLFFERFVIERKTEKGLYYKFTQTQLSETIGFSKGQDKGLTEVERCLGLLKERDLIETSKSTVTDENGKTFPVNVLTKLNLCTTIVKKTIRTNPIKNTEEQIRGIKSKLGRLIEDEDCSKANLDKRFGEVVRLRELIAEVKAIERELRNRILEIESELN